MRFGRHFTQKNMHPFDEINWIKTTSKIEDKDGNIIFKKENVEFPDFWEQNDVDITVEKYFSKNETSLTQFINRIVRWYAQKGVEGKYFDTSEDEVIFREELIYLLLHQKVAFNTPVNLNCGIQEPPQVAACFILSLEDTMDSISENMNIEMDIFRKGSGAGTNRSNLRSSKESVSSGGNAMGPLVAEQIYDKIANATKSGGRSRRAAKMSVLDIDHGDVVDFISQKAEVERAAKALIKAGWNSDFEDTKGVYKLLGLQNFNESVSVVNTFKKAIEEDEDWALLERNSTTVNIQDDNYPNDTKDTNQGLFEKYKDDWYEVEKGVKVIEWVKARDLWALICKSAWECADPGLQFKDTINKWHTCKNDGNIVSSNPCVTGNELILTPYGPKEAEIIIKEKFLNVMDGRGKHTQISKWWDNGEKDIIRVKLNSGIETKVSIDHKFILKDGSEKKASELFECDVLSPLPDINFLKLPLSFYTKELPDFRYRYQELEYDKLPKEWTEELAYFIGYLVGDGNVQDYKNNNGWIHRVHVTIGEGHPEIIKDMLLKYSTGKLQELNKQKNSVEYQVSSTPFVKFLKKLGVTDSKSEKKVPFAIWTASENIKFAFLSGLYDADGTKTFLKSTSAIFCIGNRYKFASEVWLLLKSLGILSRIRSQKMHTTFDHTKTGGKKYVYDTMSYNVTCPQADILLKSKMIHCQAFKKFNTARKRPVKKSNIIEEKVIKVERLKKEKVFDITVPTDYKFLTPIGVNVDCSEYLFLNDTSCNLASHNLLTYLKSDDTFDILGFTYATRLMITAMDISVHNSFYPTDKIKKKTIQYRTLGLGYANAGALLVNKLLPYDSDEGRNYIGAISSLLSSTSYKTSQELASELGEFPRYADNRTSVIDVLRMHKTEISKLLQVVTSSKDGNLKSELLKILECSYNYFPKIDAPVRNAQTVVIAPTGTIGLMMGCETTGLEPMLGLIIYKKMVGGGFKELTTPSVKKALKKLGYSIEGINIISKKFKDVGSAVRDPLKEEHLSIFATSFGNTNVLSPDAHLKMLAAAQPFVSGGISKTVNLPQNFTIEDIDRIYMQAWELGLKSISIYRDKCKGSQPLNLQKDNKEVNAANSFSTPIRKKLPKDRPGHNCEFQIGTQKGFLQFGFYPDTLKLGEVYIEISKGGSTINGLMNTIAMLVSHMLQYGIPVEEVINIFKELKFEPNGITSNKDIKFASSIPDYIGKYIELMITGKKEIQLIDLNALEKNDFNINDAPASLTPIIKEFQKQEDKQFISNLEKDLSGPPCNICGHIMIRGGTCYYCRNCGHTTGCA